jgi:LmbE family N-acetylglucosaminyl deacetylase
MTYTRKDYFIKTVEFIRGLYRYPRQMLGRTYDIYDGVKADILVFAAHPDDEIFGIGTVLYRHFLDNKKIKIVYVTNGSASGHGASWRNSKARAKELVEMRLHEAAQALSHLQLSAKDILCLGYPDLGTYRYLTSISKDISQLLQEVAPEKIYVHTIEGGHIDHDMTSLVVLNECKRRGLTNVYEWTEYNSMQPLGTKEVTFKSVVTTFSDEIQIRLSDEERALKRKMLASHVSQQAEVFGHQGEAIRKASFTNLVGRILAYAGGANQVNPLYVSYNRLRPILKKFN